MEDKPSLTEYQEVTKAVFEQILSELGNSEGYLKMLDTPYGTKYLILTRYLVNQ